MEFCSSYIYNKCIDISIFLDILIGKIKLCIWKPQLELYYYKNSNVCSEIKHILDNFDIFIRNLNFTAIRRVYPIQTNTYYNFNDEHYNNFRILYSNKNESTESRIGNIDNIINFDKFELFSICKLFLQNEFPIRNNDEHCDLLVFYISILLNNLPL